MRAVALGIACLAVALAACAGPQPSDGGSSPLPSSPSPTTTIDPQASPAVTAYQALWAAANNASRSPLPANSKYPAAADYTRYRFDPARSQYSAYLGALAAQGIAYRGTPPENRIAVKAVDLNASPYPQVVLTDCQTVTDWKAVVVSSGAVVPPASAKVPPPYLITATMINYQGHWGLQTSSTDSSHTCTF